MELSISEAGKLLGVHRSTLHEWIDKGYIQRNKTTKLIDTDQIVERLRVLGRARGRVAGWAYKETELSTNGDIAVTLERGVVIFSDIFKTLPPRQQGWIRRAIFDKIGDPNLLEQKEVPIRTPKKKPKETRQERVWNNVLVRGTLNPKFKTQSPAVRGLAKKIKKVALLEEANLEVPEELLSEIDSTIEPAKPQSVESK